MITKEELKEFIDEYQTFDSAMERVEEAISGRKYGLNLFECDWYESVGKLLDIFLKSHFTDDGVDLITWWLFEDVDHIIYQKVNPDLFSGETKVEYDVNDLDDLWKYMITYEKDYLKDA